ncbi:MULTISPECIES: hypothetical protein [Psychrobacter]|uniref:hypothetical protein n=1 Tax=Psychrobacter TaxID=497 RepID=UPI001918CBF0|nr:MULTISPECIES: hypothetical protein [Psychrobacter]
MHAGFIVSDGQGQLTTLSPVALEQKSDKLTEGIVKDSYLHMMSFDNHLQAL